MAFRAPKQWTLTETETITTFYNWQSNLQYHLSTANEFAPYLETEWQPKTVANRGLVNDGEAVPEADRKTAVQKNIILERMLGLVAQFVPPLLRSDIIKKSTSLAWIWTRVRKYYSFTQSEVNFLKLHTITRKEEERYETLFQRIMAHLDDNLLTVASGLQHDGAVVAQDEIMSPTTERLAVFMWLQLIDRRLPAYVSRVYAHDLSSKSLKDIQPQIAENMDSLLAELETQEDIQIHYSRSYAKQRQSFRPTTATRGSRYQKQTDNKHSTSKRSCILCKSAGRSHLGHDIGDCWFISKHDKITMSKTLCVAVDEECDEQETFEEEEVIETSQTRMCQVKRVQRKSSPSFYAHYKHLPCHVVIDSGAESSLVSRNFIKLAGITNKPTTHSATGVNKTPIGIHGEIDITLNFDGLDLPITALITDDLDCDFLAGTPFGKDNNVNVYLGEDKFSIHGKIYSYGTRNTSTSQVYRVQSLVLRNSVSQVVLPGEYVEVDTPTLEPYNGEVAVEPRTDSPNDGCWPEPSITRVVEGRIRIPNNTSSPIHLKRQQHFAQMRRVTESQISSTYKETNSNATTATVNPISLVKIDPDNCLMLDEEKKTFQRTIKEYETVFDDKFEAYNDHSGRIRAHFGIGDVQPPPQKGKLPFYSQSNMLLLQEEADKLEALGVLGKPEDIGVEVKYVSPSFLRTKTSGGVRFVTAFNNLCRYSRVPPTNSMSCNEIIRRLAPWKYIIQTDLTKSYYQIQVSKSSIPYLGTITPFKGLRVYLRSANGQPGAAEALHELTSRVYGEYIKQGFLLIIADDMIICGNTIDELHTNWVSILKTTRDNNLRLQPTKTIICPLKTTLLGWIWESGTLSVSAHKITPLATVDLPKTCTSMRSFLGAFKAISRCIPKYSTIISPLEDCIKGLQGADHINWSDELRASFNAAQSSLKDIKTITIPQASDDLILTVDASPVNNGIGATLFAVRNQQILPAEFFSFKLKSHHLNWLPCELEALAIGTSVNHFAAYIREANNPVQILTDNRPCVLAYEKLCRGQFSTSSRVSTFLSILSAHNIVLQHIKGTSNRSSDFNSRHPQVCMEEKCQICAFVNDLATSVIRTTNVKDILSGASTIPYLNHAAWKSIQHDDPTLRRTYAHLTKGTRPGRKEKNLRDLRRYIQVASLDNSGLLIVEKPDPFVNEKRLIIVPTQILPGLITALHIQLEHPTSHQLRKIFQRYFYGINSSAVIDNVVNACTQCKALKVLPKEVIEQSSTPSPEQPGKLFTADVIKRKGQMIFAARDVFTSYTLATIIKDEKHTSLRNAIISTTSQFRVRPTTVHIDNAPGFLPLKHDVFLHQKGITLDFGHVKNPNKNAVIDKGIQEVERELLKADPTGSPVSNTDLQQVVNTLNHRVRNRGLSAHEILFQRDQHTGRQINISDESLLNQQKEIRKRNHKPSSLSKAKGGNPCTSKNFRIGDLVYIKTEGDKFHARDTYIITAISGKYAIVQKLLGTKFLSRKYEVPLYNMFHSTSKTDTVPEVERHTTDSSSEEEVVHNDNNTVETVNEENDQQSEESDDTLASVSSETDDDYHPNSSNDDTDIDDRPPTTNTRPQRIIKKPPWHQDYTPH